MSLRYRDTVSCCLARGAEGVVLRDGMEHVFLTWVVKPEHTLSGKMSTFTPTCVCQRESPVLPVSEAHSTQSKQIKEMFSFFYLYDSDICAIEIG